MLNYLNGVHKNNLKWTFPDRIIWNLITLRDVRVLRAYLVEDLSKKHHSKTLRKYGEQDEQHPNEDKKSEHNCAFAYANDVDERAD